MLRELVIVEKDTRHFFILFEPPPGEEEDWRRIGLGFFPRAPATRRRRSASSCEECRLANCVLSPCTLPFSAPGEEEETISSAEDARRWRVLAGRAEELRDRTSIR